MSEKHVWTDDEDDALKTRGITRIANSCCDTLGRVYFARDENDAEKFWVVKSVTRDSLEINAIRKLLAIASPKNHTVPAELLECSISWIIVMPGLYPFRFDDSFSMDYHVIFRVLRWIAEGLDFMHERNMAHMDVSHCNIMGSECPGIIQSSTSPSATIYYIDFEATRILPSGPGSDIRINDFYSAGGGKYIPPEGVDALDPYAYDIYSLGILYDAIFRFISESTTATTRIPRFMFQFAELLQAKDPARRPSIFQVKRLLQALQTWVLVTRWLYRIGRPNQVYVLSSLCEHAPKAHDAM